MWIFGKSLNNVLSYEKLKIFVATMKTTMLELNSSRVSLVIPIIYLNYFAFR